MQTKVAPWLRTSILKPSFYLPLICIFHLLQTSRTNTTVLQVRRNWSSRAEMACSLKWKWKKPWTQMGGENNTGSGKVTAALQGNLLKGRLKGRIRPLSSVTRALTQSCTWTHTHIHTVRLQHEGKPDVMRTMKALRKTSFLDIALSICMCSPSPFSFTILFCDKKRRQVSTHLQKRTFPTSVELDFPGREHTLWHDRDAVE